MLNNFSATVLASLARYAVLVQGCWVVKSEVLNPRGTKSHIAGIDAETLWPWRNYLMFSFNRKRILSRREIVSKICLPGEEVEEMLEQMSVRCSGHEWEFKLDKDREFLHTYVDECSNQLLLWKHK